MTPESWMVPPSSAISTQSLMCLFKMVSTLSSGPVATHLHMSFLQEENPTTKIAAIAISNNFFFMVLEF